MKNLLVLLMISLMATSAFAVVDEDPDMLGVYFDASADQNALNIGINIPFFAYVMITNPSEANVWGLEFGYDVVVPAGFEGLIFRLANNLPAGSVDLGNSTSLFSGDYVAGLASPLPGQPVTTFVTWQFMILTPMTVELFLGPSQVESISDGLPAYEYGGQIKSLGLSTGGPGVPVAVVNGTGPVANEEASFGSVKSLFR
jgi:hypothetical protein